MRKLILIAVTALFLVPAASAQQQFAFEGYLAPEANTRDGHGLAVDPDGKIWFQSYYATDSVQVNDIDGTYKATRVVQVFNPDGSVADISPIKFYTENGVNVDTVGGEVALDANGLKIWSANSGRGLRTDGDGNIIITAWAYTYRINYQTGAGEGYTYAGADAGHCSGTAPAVATDPSSGHVFLGSVCPGQPVLELDADLNLLGNAIDAPYGYSRAFEVSHDGNKIYWGGYTNRDIILYERADEFSAFDSMGVVIPGFSSESFVWQPGTDWLWASAGSYLDSPNLGQGTGVTSWEPLAWYGFDASELAVDVVPTPKAVLMWERPEACATTPSDANCGRPRGIGFSPDGQTAYVTEFGKGSPSLQVHSAVPVAIEKLDDSIPDAFVLMPAYPNPFNPSANITFMLHETGRARLAVYDVTGREVAVLADETMAAGTYQYGFDATGLSSGTYLYRLEFAGQVATGQMTLVK